MGTQRDHPSVCGVEQRVHSCLTEKTRIGAKTVTYSRRPNTTTNLDIVPDDHLN